MADSRRKLTDEQKDEIRKIPLKKGRFTGATEIARIYGVSKRTIQFILEPERLIANRELAKQRKINST